MNKIWLSMCVGVALWAGAIDGIAVVVNNKAITMWEIVKLSEEKKISRHDAVELLVQKKLEEAELARQDVKVDDFELDRKLESVAQSNGMTLVMFKEALTQRLVDINEYKESLKAHMIKEKLYQKIAFQKFAPVDEKDLKLYYENNKNEFLVPKKILVISYSSPNKAALERIVKTPLADDSGIKKEESVIETKNLDVRLLSILKGTKDGSFTQVLPLGELFVSFFVKEKLDFETMEFDRVRGEVFEKLSDKKEEDAIRDYYEKLKASAKIRVVRLPN